MLAAALIVVAATAFGQGAGDVGSDGGASREPAGSLIGAFFVSRKTDPVTNERSVELLGSLVIWFLLALSIMSIGLIGHLALTNQRKAIMPPGVTEEVARLIRIGKYRQVLELT
ncbi:MAG: hypothetical protein ACYTGC_12440, partial [Planctomycetota bacterium]